MRRKCRCVSHSFRVGMSGAAQPNDRSGAWVAVSVTVLVFVVLAGSARAGPILPANTIDFDVIPIGSAGSISGIDSTAGTRNYVELQIPALSMFSIEVCTTNEGQLAFLDIVGNSGAEVPTGTGYSYSFTQSSDGSGGFLTPQQDAGQGTILDSGFNFVTTITPGYLRSSAALSVDLATGFATYTNLQTGGPAVVEVDFAGLGTSNALAPVRASYFISAVPEPATLVLIGSGLAGVGLARLRRPRQR